MGELAAPILVHADSLTFDDDAGTLSASLLADASHETPSLTLDQVIAILRPSSSSAQQPRFNIVVGLVEDSAAAAAVASAAEQQPFRLVAIQTSADNIPPQLASSVPRIAQLPAHLARGADGGGGGGGVVDYVLSTKAGAGRAVLFWETALQPLLRVAAQAFSENTVPDRLVVTNSDDSVREYAREERPAGVPRTIVLLSGDGGVVDLLNSSAPPSNEDSNNGTSSPSSSSPPPLPTIVLVPLGTGNALFNSLHKPLFTGPSELVLALRTLLNGVAAPLPTFRASFPPGSRIVKYANKDAAAAEEETTPPDVAAAEAQLFRQETHVDTLHGSIVASYGFHASIVYESDTPAYRAHGAARFGMVAQELLKTSHPYAAQLAVRRRRRPHLHHPDSESGDGDGDGDGDGGRLEKIPRATHAYVLGALVSNLERTFTISPASRPLDGQLRLVHFAPLGPARTMEAMMKAYDGGKHVEAAWDGEDGERVYYEDVDEFAVTVEDEEERWRKVCIDGTIVDIPRGGTVHVQREEKGLFHIVVDSSVL
ncbi:hypothetical protein CRV24_003276 [Beauveria bassiana]|nr:hypothetical protein CRV24_003276 [Beauveria bassiana]KAH8718682.1 hypothetical protein HC256_003313 [Beauveria bassiana]